MNRGLPKNIKLLTKNGIYTFTVNGCTFNLAVDTIPSCRQLGTGAEGVVYSCQLTGQNQNGQSQTSKFVLKGGHNENPMPHNTLLAKKNSTQKIFLSGKI